MRQEIRNKLDAEVTQLKKLLQKATSKRQGYETRLSRGVACSSREQYGNVQDKMANNMRARYHWARWLLAERSIERRMNKLTRKLTNQMVNEVMDEMEKGEAPDEFMPMADTEQAPLSFTNTSNLTIQSTGNTISSNWVISNTTTTG